MNFNLHFGELHSNNSINDKNNLFENYIPKCYKVKIILISFNCFSEYIMENGTFAPQEQMFHYSLYFKNLTFQRRLCGGKGQVKSGTMLVKKQSDHGLPCLLF